MLPIPLLVGLVGFLLSASPASRATCLAQLAPDSLTGGPSSRTTELRSPTLTYGMQLRNLYPQFSSYDILGMRLNHFISDATQAIQGMTYWCARVPSGIYYLNLLDMEAGFRLRLSPTLSLTSRTKLLEYGATQMRLTLQLGKTHTTPRIYGIPAGNPVLLPPSNTHDSVPQTIGGPRKLPVQTPGAEWDTTDRGR